MRLRSRWRRSAHPPASTRTRTARTRRNGRGAIRATIHAAIVGGRQRARRESCRAGDAHLRERADEDPDRRFSALVEDGAGNQRWPQQRDVGVGEPCALRQRDRRVVFGVRVGETVHSGQEARPDRADDIAFVCDEIGEDESPLVVGQVLTKKAPRRDAGAVSITSASPIGHPVELVRNNFSGPPSAGTGRCGGDTPIGGRPMAAVTPRAAIQRADSRTLALISHPSRLRPIDGLERHSDSTRPVAQTRRACGPNSCQFDMSITTTLSCGCVRPIPPASSRSSRSCFRDPPRAHRRGAPRLEPGARESRNRTAPACCRRTSTARCAR